MNIICKSEENMNKETLYKLTLSRDIKKMTTAKNSRMEVKAWLVHDDVNQKTGEVMQIVAVMDENGECFATNSPSFVRGFLDIVTLFGEDFHAMEIRCGKSNAGREYIYPEYIVG